MSGITFTMAEVKAMRRAAKLLADYADELQQSATYAPEHVDYPPEDAHLAHDVAEHRRIARRLLAILDRECAA